jgi:hypothetical protein
MLLLQRHLQQTAACVRAGASLMPSPTIDTDFPLDCNSLMTAALPAEPRLKQPGPTDVQIYSILHKEN